MESLANRRHAVLVLVGLENVLPQSNPAVARTVGWIDSENTPGRQITQCESDKWRGRQESYIFSRDITDVIALFVREKREVQRGYTPIR